MCWMDSSRPGPEHTLKIEMQERVEPVYITRKLSYQRQADLDFHCETKNVGWRRFGWKNRSN